MQTRLILGMTWLMALVACRPNTPSELNELVTKENQRFTEFVASKSVHCIEQEIFMLSM